MLVLICFTPNGETEQKTLFNDFELKSVISQYREPIDNDVVRLLAAKMAFENNARSVKMWIGKLPDVEDKLLKKEWAPIMKTIG